MFVAKLVGMEIVHDGDCKAVVIAIITDMCPLAVEMEAISMSCDPEKATEMLNCSSMYHNKI